MIDLHIYCNLNENGERGEHITVKKKQCLEESSDQQVTGSSPLLPPEKPPTPAKDG
jgi:hypothetical protein